MSKISPLRSWSRVIFSSVAILIFTCKTAFAIAGVTLSEGPSNVSAIQGEDAILRCIVDHVPGDVDDPVQWVKGTIALGRDRDIRLWDRYEFAGDISLGEYFLRIRNVQLEDDDVYECQVTDYSLRSNPAKFTVLIPPTVHFNGNQQSDTSVVKVVAGRENEIKCEAWNAKPPATLEWYQDGNIVSNVDIPPPVLLNKLYNTSATIRIRPTAEKLNSTYTCVATSKALQDELIVRRVSLHLINRPNVSLILPDDLKEGMEAKVKCDSQSESTVTSYRWYVNDYVQSNQLGVYYDLGVLSKHWHRTTLACEAANVAGYSNPSSAMLNVFYSPTFLGGKTSDEVAIGDNVTFHCGWDSNPPSIVKWTREGSDKVLANGEKLVLRNVAQTDGGKYTCHAEARNVGSKLQIYTLVVNGPPILSSSSTSTQLGGNALVTCKISSNPGISDVTWTWIKNGQKLSLHNNNARGEKFQGEFQAGSRVANLKIYNITEDDYTTYSCKVTNSFGFRTTDLVLNRAPDRLQQKAALATEAIIGICVAAIACIIVAIVGIYLYQRRRHSRVPQSRDGDVKENENLIEMTRVHNCAAPSTDGDCYHVTPPSRPGTAASSGTPTSGQDDGYHTEGTQRDGHTSWNGVNTFKSDPTSEKLMVNLEPLDESAVDKFPILLCSGSERAAWSSRYQPYHHSPDVIPSSHPSFDSFPDPNHQQPFSRYSISPTLNPHDYTPRLPEVINFPDPYPHVVGHLDSTGRTSDLSHASHSSRSSAASHPLRSATQV